MPACSAGSRWPRRASRSRDCRPGSAGSATGSGRRPGSRSTSSSGPARSRAPIVIGRDHLDSGSVASPNRETEAMLDGTDAVADWPLLNALVNTAAGASWVSIHHGGGVGIGYSQHAGMVVVADGTDLAAQKLERVLTTDPAMGVLRHVDAGYERAIEVARTRGIHVPMLEDCVRVGGLTALGGSGAVSPTGVVGDRADRHGPGRTPRTGPGERQPDRGDPQRLVQADEAAERPADQRRRSGSCPRRRTASWRSSGPASARGDGLAEAHLVDVVDHLGQALEEHRARRGTAPPTPPAPPR